MSEQYEIIRSKSTQELEKIMDMSGGAFSGRSGGGRYDALVDVIRQKRQERVAEMGKARKKGLSLRQGKGESKRCLRSTASAPLPQTSLGE